MINIRQADRHDVSAVFSAISDQSADEIEAMGLTTAQVALVYRIKADQGDAYVSEDEDNLLTLFGFNEFDDHYSMWSVGTKSFFNGGVPLVLATRRFFDALNFPKPLAVITHAPHPDVDRWLRLIGLRYSGEQDGAKVYWQSRPDLH